MQLPEAAAAVHGLSMTLARAGLRALQAHDTPARSAAMAAALEQLAAAPLSTNSREVVEQYLGRG